MLSVDKFIVVLRAECRALALGFWCWDFGVGLLALGFSRLRFPRLGVLVLSFVVGVFALGFCILRCGMQRQFHLTNS